MAFNRRRKSKIALATTIHSKSWAVHQQKKRRSRNLKSRMKMLRAEMEGVSVEQEIIKEGQRQVREKFEAIEKECDQLRRETNLVVQQSVSTHIRLALMFGILKARENHDFSKASQLTSALRELVTRKNL
ncbi:hypothetical protein COLO4_03335 [Corchorus olitorius]|uniref:Uncharacterized protein n=1 Tax=Corchorus olitorius TaxID=93759 RepID=A0A1R3KYU3_9ROSI|nr:hypothetical protein COLO4_03335 [Corchorus olitorius]